MSDEQKPKLWIPWWPMGVFRENESCSDEFFMSIAFLFLAYFFSFCLLVVGLRYFAYGIAALYFALTWLNVWFVEDLTPGQKWRALAQQMFVTLLLTSPLFFLFRMNWSV